VSKHNTHYKKNEQAIYEQVVDLIKSKSEENVYECKQSPPHQLKQPIPFVTYLHMSTKLNYSDNAFTAKYTSGKIAVISGIILH